MYGFALSQGSPFPVNGYTTQDIHLHAVNSFYNMCVLYVYTVVGMIVCVCVYIHACPC